jgi:hypothetical protein
MDPGIFLSKFAAPEQDPTLNTLLAMDNIVFTNPLRSQGVSLFVCQLLSRLELYLEHLLHLFSIRQTASQLNPRNEK